jgi:hypothetical protein
MSRAGQLPIAGRLAVGSSRMASGRVGPPFIILFEQDCTDEPDDCVLVWKDSDHFGTRFYLAVESSSGLVDWRRHIGHDAPVDNIEPITTYVRR